MATSKPRLDRRIVRSRNAILSAFERLLMEKPLADITVSAIAREANVDRKTFYVHFGTVDGLLDAIAVDVVEMIVDSVEKTLASMDGDTNERALGAAATFFKTVNEALCNNLVLNRQLIENIPLDDFMARLRAPLEHEIAERDLLRWRPVRLSDAHGGSEGLCEGVAADGALLVRDASGVLQSITSAEVSVRPHPHPHAPGA